MALINNCNSDEDFFRKIVSQLMVKLWAQFHRLSIKIFARFNHIHSEIISLCIVHPFNFLNYARYRKGRQENNRGWNTDNRAASLG